MYKSSRFSRNSSKSTNQRIFTRYHRRHKFMKMIRRIVIPETTFTPRVLPYERLLQGLVEVLQESQAESNEAGYRRQGDRGRCCVPEHARTGCPGFKPWFYTTINVGRYRPAEVNVKIEDGCVIIHAKHEERDGEDFDLTETRRTVKLPNGVDEKRLTCIYQADGRILIKAPPAPVAGTTETPKPAKGDKSDGDADPEKDVSDSIVNQRPQTSSADERTTVADPVQRESSGLMFAGKSKAGEPVILDVIQKGEDDRPEEEGHLDITRQLEPLDDSVRVVDDGDQKKLEVSLNLKDFDKENMSVQLADNELIIGAKKEVSENGMYSLKEVHRMYPVPKTGSLDSARAQITADGLVTVTVPLDAEPKDETKTVPIDHDE